MNDYIDRKAALSVLKRMITPNKSPAQREMIRTAEIEMNRIPTADVVEVVRCKECKKSGVTEFGKRYCKEPLGMYGVIPTSDDNFCSYGER